VIYDLLGALFAPHDPVPASLHADKLFTRICDVVRGRFAEPEFGPCEAAAEAGISLRYLQKYHLHAFHQFGPAGSRRVSPAPPGDDEHEPADQRDRLRQRL
jgi:hypothetical protein